MVPYPCQMVKRNQWIVFNVFVFIGYRFHLHDSHVSRTLLRSSLSSASARRSNILVYIYINTHLVTYMNNNKFIMCKKTMWIHTYRVVVYLHVFKSGDFLFINCQIVSKRKYKMSYISLQNKYYAFIFIFKRWNHLLFYSTFKYSSKIIW